MANAEGFGSYYNVWHVEDAVALVINSSGKNSAAFERNYCRNRKITGKKANLHSSHEQANRFAPSSLMR